MRRLKEMQEEDRRKKLEELKQHVSQSERSKLRLNLNDYISGPECSAVPRTAGSGETATH